MTGHLEAAFRTAWETGRAVTFDHKSLRVTVNPSGRVTTERIGS